MSDVRHKKVGAAQAEPQGEQEALSLALHREKRLVERARSGDRQALTELLEPHVQPLYAQVILPRAGDVTVAEDVLKATMVTAIEKLHTFRWDDRSIYFWLRQVAVNKVIDHHRKTQRGRRLADALSRESELLSVAPTAMPGPESSLIAREERRINKERIGAALGQLSPRYRRVIELRLIEERPRQECAEELAVSLGTFDVLLYRAVRAFRRAFGERDE